MAIRFRCTHCTGLLSISSRKAGSLVTCPTCGEQTLVPWEEAFEEPEQQNPPAVEPAPAAAPPPELDEEIVFVAYQQDEPQPPAPVVASAVEPLNATAGVESVGPPAERPAKELEESRHSFQFQSRRLAEDDDEMDLTPMVDVTFLLLIFFMVTASFSLQKSIETPTPQPDQQGAAQSLQNLEDLQGTSILVKIDATNSLTVDDEPWPDVERLAEALRDKMRREQKTEVIITADSAALHRTVVTVIDAANDAGIQKIRLGSRKG